MWEHMWPYFLAAASGAAISPLLVDVLEAAGKYVRNLLTLVPDAVVRYLNGGNDGKTPTA